MLFNTTLQKISETINPSTDTEAEAEAALAYARQSDPSWPNDRFYYNGYQSRTDLHEDMAPAATAPPLDPDYFHGSESVLYYHPADDTWRLFRPESDFPVEVPEYEMPHHEVPDDECENEKEDTKSKKQRKCGDLRRLGRLGIKIFKKVTILKRDSKRD